MPPTYTRKLRKYRKNSGQKKLQRWAKKRRGARSQAGQIVKLSKSIGNINTRIAATKIRHGLYHEIFSTAIPGIDVDYQCYRLQPAYSPGPGPECEDGPQWIGSESWANMFETNNVIRDVPTVRLGRMHITMQFNAGNEDAPVNFSVFHAKLQPEHANMMLTEFGLELTNLNNTSHYLRGEYSTSSNATCSGDVTLNPTYFKVIKSWKWQFTGTMPGTGEYSTVPTSTYKRIQYSFPLGYKLGRDGVSTSWRTANADTDTPDHLKNYLFIFCNNSNLDAGQSPTMSILARCNATATI